MKTEIILFDSESYDPHKYKRYYSPTLVQLRTAVKKERKPYFWTPRKVGLLLMFLAAVGIVLILITSALANG